MPSGNPSEQPGQPLENPVLIFFLLTHTHTGTNPYWIPILGQSAVVGHFSLTEENKHDHERVQKSSVKIILKERYKDYSSSLDRLDLGDLNTRKEKNCQNLAQQRAKNVTLNSKRIMKKKKH